MALQPHPHPKLLGLLLLLDSLKLESCKFNIIINIINITLRSSVIGKLKALGYIFVEKPNTLRSLIFLCKKKINQQCMPLIFFSF